MKNKNRDQNKKGSCLKTKLQHTERKKSLSHALQSRLLKRDLPPLPCQLSSVVFWHKILHVYR